MKADTVAAVIEYPTEQWPGNCYSVAVAMLRAGMAPDGTVARYGHWLGAVAPGTLFAGRPIVVHGWLESPGETIIDPTRWVFEGVAPYIYCGPNDYYDMGGNCLRQALLKPPPEHNPEERQSTYALTDGSMTYVASLLQQRTPSPILSLSQRIWLLNLPLNMLQPHAGEIYTAAILSGDGAFIPLDNRQVVLN